jgi:hypothetical protein
VSTGIAEGDKTTRMESPAARAPFARVLRALALGLTGGAAFLFICRDLAHASAAVCIAGAVVGVLFGLALALVDPEPVSPTPPS